MPKHKKKVLSPITLLLTRCKVVIYCLLGNIPERLQVKLARVLGTWVWQRTRNAKHRHICETNLRLCFPGKSDDYYTQCSKRVFIHSALGILQTFSCWFQPIDRFDKKIIIENGEAFKAFVDEQFAQNKPIFLNGYHSVYLEMLSVAVCRKFGLEVVAMYRKDPNPVMDRMIHKGRTKYVRCLVPSRDPKGLIRELRNRPDSLCWMTSDEGVKRSYVYASFFGNNASTNTAMLRLAGLFKAHIVDLSVRREDSGYYRVRLGVEDAFIPGKDLQAEAEKLNRLTEQSIAFAPDQYLWQHRRFKKQPPGQKSPYER